MALDAGLTDINQKVLVDSLLAPLSGLVNSSMQQFAIGIEDARASQRRANQAADAAHAAQLLDYRLLAAAQAGLLTGATSARQDSLATTEAQQATADATVATAGAMADQTRLQSTLAEQVLRMGTAIEATIQQNNAVYTNIATLAVSISAVAEALAKIAGTTPPVTVDNKAPGS